MTPRLLQVINEGEGYTLEFDVEGATVTVRSTYSYDDVLDAFGVDRSRVVYHWPLAEAHTNP